MLEAGNDLLMRARGFSIKNKKTSTNKEALE